MTTAVDIVIPTLNAGPSLSRTLEALPTHADLAFSTTICDGGSHDDTVALARRAGAAVVTAAPGRGGQLATGAAAGRAPWILFLHADTRLQGGAGTVIARFVQSIDGKAGYFRLRFDAEEAGARRVERLAAWRCRTFGLPYGDQGLLISRAHYERLGGFRPLPLMEDVDLVRRIGRNNLVPLGADALTSATRYRRDGWRLRPLRNLTCLTLYFAGVPPRTLRRLYG
ncbi:MAG: glycosyltransferase [Reyranella sp.]|uniref:TIGR04283 family arsenosugar biosynthesis glycosyltransferase n=1 Tax=Reyranella sp. TaxID=1929291 RepID=UPI0011F9244A|nr:TIGR04283 family arsenosugar biosynthesis glycosyltransferase [Reyranella sp.]TAJ96157.1 MAG: glycosyltransferase [Reyranella sp.]TBR29575.1 MAG: glycosyltransferase [Reyranella sp.]